MGFDAGLYFFAKGRLHDFLAAHVTEMRIAPGRCARHVVASVDLLSRSTATWAVFPTLLAHQMVQLRSSVTTMLDAVRLDGLLAVLAPVVVAGRERAVDDLSRVVLLSYDEGALFTASAVE